MITFKFFIMITLIFIFYITIFVLSAFHAYLLLMNSFTLQARAATNRAVSQR